MPIERFTDLPSKLTKVPISTPIGGTIYYGFQLSTYTINEGDAIKIGDTIELSLNSEWVYYLWDFELKQWMTVEGDIITLSISYASNSSIVNEGDVYVSRTTVLKTGTAVTGEDLYAVLEETEAGSTLIWYNLDGSLYQGPINSITLTMTGDTITNTVTATYAQLDESLNIWLYLFYVVTIDNSGNILQVQYLTENGAVFILGDLLISDRPVFEQTTEVYSFTSDELVTLVSIEDYINSRTVLDITLNIVTPRTRKYGKGRSILLLGTTTQELPPGRKLYHDHRCQDHKIKTYPRMELSNGSFAECDLRFSIAPTIVKTYAAAAA